MSKQEPISKVEAMLKLHSQPISAPLWKMATDEWQEHKLRFPDPSYLDSQSWPDYYERSKEISKESTAITENVNNYVTNDLEENNFTPVDNQFIERDEKINSESRTFEIDSDDKNDSDQKIDLLVASTDLQNDEIMDEHFSEMELKEDVHTTSHELDSEIKHVNMEPSAALDFYSWLESLNKPQEILTPVETPIKNEPAATTKKSKPKAEKPGVSTEEAKTIAENSVKLGEEIVSETLARLLARQGHKLEAIEMYQKLILKYPEKQTTFAAAIQKLKS